MENTYKLYYRFDTNQIKENTYKLYCGSDTNQIMDSTYKLYRYCRYDTKQIMENTYTDTKQNHREHLQEHLHVILRF